MTSHQHNGSAVVDYVIVSVNLLRNIGNFVVGGFSAWVSDHCNLLYDLKAVHDIPIEKEILGSVPKSFRFKEGDREKFTQALRLEENLLDELVVCPGNSEFLVDKTTETLISTCQKAGIKQKKQSKKRFF